MANPIVRSLATIFMLRCDRDIGHADLVTSLEKPRVDPRFEEGADNASENFSLVDGLGSKTLMHEHVGRAFLGIGANRGVRRS